MPSTAATIDAEIVEVLCDRLDAGNNYVNVNHVSGELEHNSWKLGSRLSELEDMGLLEQWTDGKAAPTYRIVAERIRAGDIDERIERHISARERTGATCFDGQPGGERA